MARRTGSTAEVTGPRVRAAALRLFARHGFAAVSMRQIAAEVGLQAGALYLYTADKESLLFDLLRSHMEELIAALRTEVWPDDPAARLSRFVAFHIRRNLDHPDAVFLSYMELRNLGPQNFAAVERLRADYEATLSTILKDGVERGQFRVPDVRLATMAVIAMLNGVNTWFREGGRLGRTEVIDIQSAMVLRAVGAGDRAAAGLSAPAG
jgi:AcrR family transcriptional regulator